jgi:DNA polymerase I-like protein with 3'-5' exonuclease and polymerase domains
LQVLNFSIAYGKTAHGLSKDFKTSLEEAQETVNKWYADRPEVSRCHAREAHATRICGQSLSDACSQQWVV